MIVPLQAPADRPVTAAKILCRDAFKDGRHRTRLGGAIRRADAVLVQSGHGAIADEHDPVVARAPGNELDRRNLTALEAALAAQQAGAQTGAEK